MEILSRSIIEDDDPDLSRQFSAWIKGVVKYARLEYLRQFDYPAKESSLDDVPAEMLSYEDPMPVSKDQFDFTEDKLSQEFSKINLLRRKILTLLFVGDLPAQEVADRLSCPVKSVYREKHRTLKRLRDQLMNGGDDNGA